MKLIYAYVVWALISLVIGLGIYLVTVKGSPWLLIIAAVGFITMVGAIGCRTH